MGLGMDGDFAASSKQLSDYGKLLGRTLVAAVIGGTASAVGGGKFANGAYTAAFQHLSNQERPWSETHHNGMDGKLSIDSNVFKHDGVPTAGKVQIHWGRHKGQREEFTWDSMRREWVNDKGQRLPKEARAYIQKNRSPLQGITKAFEAQRDMESISGVQQVRWL